MASARQEIQGGHVYLHKLTIAGFRALETLEVQFARGLNLLIGPNNAGKTAVIDALRVLLSAGDEGALRVSDLDRHVSKSGATSSDATFKYIFRGLTLDEEADFVTALTPYTEGSVTHYQAELSVRYSDAGTAGRQRVQRWAGAHEDTPLTNDMNNDLRAVYLQPLRDPTLGLRPGRSSQLARLLQCLATAADQEEVIAALKTSDGILQSTKAITSAQGAITKRHTEMLGKVLCQALEVNLSPGDFKRVAARLGMLVANFDVEQNGLGFNNLIYMAVVLSELATSKDAAYRALIVEEPEAHLHPQLQAVLLSYLSSVETPADGESPVQVFLTSHSPNFAALAELDSVTCLYPGATSVETFSPRTAVFEPRTKLKLQRYLNVTRAELFFARRVILVEGAAELFLVEVLAAKHGLNLRKHAVSVISADGLNFDAFAPLFGPNALKIRAAVLSDSDEDGFPNSTDAPLLSSAAASLASKSNEYLKVYFALRTFEYNLALIDGNRPTMLAALTELHPALGPQLAAQVNAAPADQQAAVLFRGMFDRGAGKNVQKGAFAQALALKAVNDNLPLEAPQYIKDALTFVCDTTA